jgi:hypothetical protein
MTYLPSTNELSKARNLNIAAMIRILVDRYESAMMTRYQGRIVVFIFIINMHTPSLSAFILCVRLETMENPNTIIQLSLYALIQGVVYSRKQRQQ